MIVVVVVVVVGVVEVDVDGVFVVVDAIVLPMSSSRGNGGKMTSPFWLLCS